MRHRALGRTGLVVSEIGFGTWGLGGVSYGPVDDDESRRALELAFDRGVTFYDTSDLYGDGHSEAVLGQTFAGCRSAVVIGTKVGTLPHTGFYMPQDFSAERITGGVEASLKRLRTDYIDLYQLHSPQLDLPNWDEIVGTMQRLQDAGKIRAFGISARSPGDALLAIERHHFAVVQVNFNLIDHRAIDGGLFDHCQLHNVGVIARTPLCFGYLTGTMTGEEEFAPGDHRANWPREQLRRWARAPEVFAPLNQGRPRTLTQMALGWCISHPAVSTVIPGMIAAHEVAENTDPSAVAALSDDEVTQVRSLYRDQLFYDPKAKVVKPPEAGGHP